MDDWRLAKSLDGLRRQVNEAYPKRSKASDGTIGDRAHAARKSDHNPNSKGVVLGIDITHDPANGLGGRALANAILASRDKRVKYIISDGQIASGFGQPHPYGVWRRYTGANPHAKHVHISVRDDASLYDSTASWSIGGGAVSTAEAERHGLKKGDTGPYVRELQSNLRALGHYEIVVDGRFGDQTHDAVMLFQRMNGLEPDGIAGPRTQEAIGKALKARENKAKIDAAKKVVEPAAKDGVGLNEVGGGIISVAPAVAAAKEVVEDVSEGVTSLMTLGPWLLLAAVGIGFGIYVIRNERRKKAAAKQAMEAME